MNNRKRKLRKLDEKDRLLIFSLRSPILPPKLFNLIYGPTGRGASKKLDTMTNEALGTSMQSIYGNIVDEIIRDVYTPISIQTKVIRDNARSRAWEVKPCIY